MRSFDEPPGFWPSSLAQMRTSGFGDSWCTPTSGVSPISPRMSSYFGTRQPPATAGRIESDVAVGELGVEAVEVADVVVVLVDVDELVQAARVVEQVAAQAGVALDQRGEHLADGRAVDARRSPDRRPGRAARWGA